MDSIIEFFDEITSPNYFLAIDQALNQSYLYDSPLSNYVFDLNRIAYNKPHFWIRTIFEKVALQHFLVIAILFIFLYLFRKFGISRIKKEVYCKNHILVAVLLIGGFLRFFNISNSPPSLNWDEAALGYNAYSILHTGKDEYGVTLPLITRSFDDYKSMFPVYPMVVSIRTFGLNEFGVRFPTALFSTLTIFVIYCLTKELLKSDKAGLSAAFFFAIEPWALHLGRVYHEATFSLLFYLGGILLFLKSVENKKLLVLSIIFGLVSLFSYHTNKVLVPLTLFVIAFLFRKQLRSYPKRVIAASILVLCCGGILFLHQVLFANALARAESASILRDVAVKDLPLQISLRYLSYFSPANLFVSEPKEPASVLPGNSMFFPFELIFWLVGLAVVLSAPKKNKLLIFLILVSPIAASFTWNWFEPARVLSLFSFYGMLVGYGSYIIWEKGKIAHRLINLMIFLPLIIMSVFYVFDSVNYKIAAKVYGNWQPGFRESMATVYAKSAEYEKVIVDTDHAQPYIFVLFYSQYPPEKYLRELDLNKISNPRKVYDFGKFVFKRVNFSTEVKDPNVLYVLWKDTPGYTQLDNNDLAYLNEVKNVDNDTIVKIVTFKND